MNSEKNEIPSLRKTIIKWLPGIALVLLTLSLMIFFKSRSNIGSIMKQGTGELLKFYTQNLQPLLWEQPIKNEDVFNFALYRNVPVSKERNRILQIDADENGQEFFEIKPVVIKSSTNNLEKFTKYMELSENEIEEFNKLLDSYKYDIYASILTKEKNTIAVDPNIINLHRAILADISKFAQSKNLKLAAKLIPIQFASKDYSELDRLVKNVREAQPEELIFYTPDTVFSISCELQKDKLINEIRRAELANTVENLGTDKFSFEIKAPKMISGNLIKDFKIERQDGTTKVFPTSSVNMKVVAPELRQLNEELGRVTFKISSDMTDVARAASEVAFIVSKSAIAASVNTKMDDEFHFEFNLDNVELNIDDMVSELESVNPEKWEEFGKRMSEIFSDYDSEDTLGLQDLNNLKTDMTKLKKELEQVTKEMKNNRKLNKPKRK